jgi:signal transduction histidine kinase
VRNRAEGLVCDEHRRYRAASMPGVAMLEDFLAQQRAEILEQWTRRVASDLDGGDLSRVELLDHMPSFIDDLIECLHRRPAPEGDGVTRSQNAPEHGRQRLRVGFDVDEVVREYGILADLVLQAVEAAGVELPPHDVRVLQAMLNQGAADAVRAYVHRREEDVRRQSARHLSFIAHELRTPLGSASTALAVLRHATPGANDNEAIALIGRNLGLLRDLIDQVLVEGRLDAGVAPDCSPIDFAELIRQAAEDSSWHARSRDVRLLVATPATLPGIGDRRLLRSTIENLVRNAVKFSPPGAEITVSAAERGADVTIEVADGCGGFEPAAGIDVFAPFVQAGGDRTGFGLGLAIAKQAAEAHGGTIVHRNTPPRGCVFAVTLPNAGPPPST